MSATYVFSVVLDVEVEVSPEVHLVVVWKKPTFFQMSDEATQRNII